MSKTVSDPFDFRNSLILLRKPKALAVAYHKATGRIAEMASDHIGFGIGHTLHKIHPGFGGQILDHIEASFVFRHGQLNRVMHHVAGYHGALPF